MLKAKVFEVLKTFSKEDYAKFRQFVDSEYFNSSDMLRKLYSVIEKHTKSTSTNGLSSELIFEELYPGKKFREATIVNLLSGLYKLSQDFVSVEQFKKEPLGMGRYLLKGLGSRGLNKFFIQNYNRIIEELNQIKIHNEDYFHSRYEIDQHLIAYTNTESAYIATKTIQSWHDKLADFILVKILDGYIFMLNRKKYGYEHEFNMSFMEPVIKYIKENSSESNPAIAIYFNLMMLLKDDKAENYYKLKELLKSNPGILDYSDTWSVYICMVNFCHTMYESGYKEELFSKEIHELYKIILEEKIYVVEAWHPYIHHRLYLNIVQNGLQQNELEWTENFIKEYKEKLIEDNRPSTCSLAYALFYFSKGEFEKSLQELNKVQSEDAFYFLQIKALMLQIYYELKLYDAAFSLIDSYKHYLKEKTEIPSRYKERHKHFVAAVNKLLKIKSGKYENRPSELFLAGDVNNIILKKEWVHEKIKGLAGNA